MAKEPEKPDSGGAEEEFAMSPEIIARAKGCFDRADDAARRNNFDYAIELYLEGLRCTPDDVERGHKALFETAVRRLGAGKNKSWGTRTAGIKSNMLQMTGKKKEAFLEMERSMAGKPDNYLDLAALAQMALNLNLQGSPLFFADKALESARRMGKLSETLCVQMADIYEARAKHRTAMMTLMEAEHLDKTGSGRHMKRIRDLAARTTLGAGLEDADSFHDRIRDQETARDSAMQKVLTAEDELVARAEKLTEQLKETPNDLNLMITIGDTYTRAGRDEEAMAAYRKARTASGGADYRIKVKMDDLRMRQLRRDLRAVEEQLTQEPGSEPLQAKRKELIEKRNQAELAIFEERTREYPTDMSVRYELALRQYRSDQIEAAIGSFQLATRDPKHKVQSLNMLGKCFFKSRLLQEAAAQFKTAIDGYELQGDALWKELRYNLGMTFETMKKHQEAIDCYSEIVMTDFQYRDAAKRLSKLRKELEGDAGIMPDLDTTLDD
ncbi:MAG: tetratricopeptide repeat protein [Planctomycetes bacterium]|nr:tetratricopeptide repeat protein [Planctomycetota bacterium]